MLPNYITSQGKLNLKADVLKLNGEKIDKTNGWIDLVKTEGNKAYIDNYEIIDLNHLNIGGVGIYRNSNPTDPLDELIKREYDTHQFRKAGPQIRHTIKLLDLEKGKYNTLTGFTDNEASGYEHYSMPADKGIVVVSRETGKKEHVY